MPRPDTAALLAQVQTVLAEYQAYLPLTIRQIFYRLVGAHGYEKTDHAYGRLCEHLNRARRARLIDMDAIRDDGITAIGGPGWASVDEYVDSLRRRAKYFRLDRTAGQTNHLVVLCEAAGMAPQLAEVTGPYDIKVMSGGGFDSLTAKYEFATELACQDRSTEVLHIGDHDPRGVSLFISLLEDVQAFTHQLGGEAKFTRLAVTPEQKRRYALPTAPPKKTDRRAFRGRTCQAEAFAPDVLADIVRTAIESRLKRAPKPSTRLRPTSPGSRASIPSGRWKCANSTTFCKGSRMSSSRPTWSSRSRRKRARHRHWVHVQNISAGRPPLAPTGFKHDEFQLWPRRRLMRETEPAE